MISVEGFRLFESDSVWQALPELIIEADPNRQAARLEKLLEKHVPVNGFAISVSSENSSIHLTADKSIHGDLLDKLGRAFFSRDKTSANAQNHLMAFKSETGEFLTLTPENPEVTRDADGLAFCLKGKDLQGVLYLLTDHQTLRSFILHAERTNDFIECISSLLANSYMHFRSAEKMRFFNLYETVSSALGYVGDLQELLTTIISIVTSELPSEEGSVLLLDDSTNELEFFSAIGETGYGLAQLRFPADRGIAGYAMQNREAIIVNDVQTCPYFFKNIDEDSGFTTRTILAAPLISGEECVGVIEAINKVGRDSFDEQDKKILMAIADEVALAIKNARLFEYVVNSYCNIRQGKGTCKGCVRPLKSWTPCARQLE